MSSFVRSAGTRTVGGVDVRLTETTWSTGPGSSFDVYLASDGTCLTMDESLDEEPSDDQIAALIAADRDQYGYLA
jgi:hypothetical protein